MSSDTHVRKMAEVNKRLRIARGKRGIPEETERRPSKKDTGHPLEPYLTNKGGWRGTTHRGT